MSTPTGNISEAIRLIQSEIDQLQHVVDSLQALNDSSAVTRVTVQTGKKRGRKNMGTDERHEVSERMKRYWAGRRKQRGAGQR